MVLKIQCPKLSPLRPSIERATSARFNSTRAIPFCEYLPIEQVKHYLPSQPFYFLARSKRVHAVLLNGEDLLIHPEGFFKFTCTKYSKQMTLEKILGEGPFVLH